MGCRPSDKRRVPDEGEKVLVRGPKHRILPEVVLPADLLLLFHRAVPFEPHLPPGHKATGLGRRSALLSKRVWGKGAHKVAGEPGDVSALGDVLVGSETHLAGPVLIVADGADAAVRCEQRHAVLVQVAAQAAGLRLVG